MCERIRIKARNLFIKSKDICGIVNIPLKLFVSFKEQIDLKKVFTCWVKRRAWLSLSYDIFKAHGGTISINTREGEFSKFIIRIPAIHNALFAF